MHFYYNDLKNSIALIGGIKMGIFQIKVEFCMQWNYSPKAARFAEDLFSHFRTRIEKMELIPASGGVFEVTVNGEKIYSKDETGLFPSSAEIIAKLEN